MSTYTITELKEIISTLKQAYERAASSGGVTSYTINSGQSSTTVAQASLSSIRNEIEHYSNILNDMTEIENGSHCSSLGGLGAL